MPQFTVTTASAPLPIPAGINPKRMAFRNTGSAVAYWGFAPLTASDGTDGIALAPGATAPYGDLMLFDERNIVPLIYFISPTSTTINFTFHP